LGSKKGGILSLSFRELTTLCRWTPPRATRHNS